MNLSELNCENWGTSFANDSFIKKLGTLKCNYCDSLFSFSNDDAPKNIVQREPLSLPEKFNVQKSQNVPTITYKWFNTKFIFLTLFCVCWNLFVLGWMGSTLLSGRWLFSLFGFIFVGLGIGLSYLTLAGYINSTTIQAGSKHLPFRRGNHSTTCSYEVHATMKSGKGLKPLSGLENPEQALYIEQELKAFLNLKARPARSELPR